MARARASAASDKVPLGCKRSRSKGGSKRRNNRRKASTKRKQRRASTSRTRRLTPEQEAALTAHTGIDGNLSTAASVQVVESTVAGAIDDLDDLSELGF